MRPETRRNFVAFDCSNSSIRTLLGRYDGKRIELQTIAQFPNRILPGEGYDYWDIRQIWAHMKEGLRRAAAEVRIDAIGVCTWGVDFSFLDREGDLTHDPLAYRNPFGEEELQRYSPEEQSALFQDTGILCDKINSLFMLQAVRRRFPERLEPAEHLLMIPDIFHYFLTGVIQNEPSELSTSQLMDVKTQSVSQRVCEQAGIDPALLGPLGVHGEKIGDLKQELKEELGIGYDIPVICVPSHDTAAAILAIPTHREDFVYISSGTWALIGAECREPVISPEAERAQLTNELGAFGRITLLRNNAGLFLLQRLREEEAPELDWNAFSALADLGDSAPPLFDVNDPALFNPDNMAQAIQEALRRTGQAEEPLSLPTLVRSVLWSMACSYRTVIEQIEEVTGQRASEIYIVGGGTQNRQLCQAAADITGKTVVTGGTESTGLGNVLAQIRYFEPDRTVEDLRRVAAASVETRVYPPRAQNPAPKIWKKYRRLCQKGV